MSLPARKIGDALVNPIGFGTMVLAAAYGVVGSDEERFKVLDAAYNSGCTHWDSADIYADCEDLLGKWFKRTGKRNEIFLATKFGYTLSGGRGDPAYVKEQCAKSLERLGVDYIDLYYQHRPDRNVPIEETVGAMAELVKEGKVKYLGLSECTAKDLRRAHAVHPIAAIQIEYSPLVLDIEDPKLAILATARELGVTVVAYSPLARGLVAGLYKSPDQFEANDSRRAIPKHVVVLFSKENFPKILDVVDHLKVIGNKHDATSSQVTLAWILAQGDDFVVIPGTKKAKYVEENAGAAKVRLSSEDVAAVRKIAEESDIPGTRYDEAGMNMVLVSTPELPK
ncbi:NADP-dependent oxidoreductase domain-containing protein [Desarmillaria tabescens]|uniref:NADP-dependent oxidoreductase domain-containing protein n=1 Tax=Armillaria tabescens TaxID=1929756 RepID=A0AA39JU01_ARMTA|nr:NADP-dependent oxidoreductase domain-containing protein [Desarmillaria tabescens]KAK0447806.1 NADP-dependent oxidoreductase domain-containing protein [Desarmillaria tabescens]